MKSRSRGYASMEYNLIGYRTNALVKLDVMINGDKVDPLAAIVHKDKAYYVGRALTEKAQRADPASPIQNSDSGLYW